ncbi:hypothetical protein ABE41_018555 [Fictibacillus arsenicus]|uniref:DUF1648 domain-containing protein n=1 Tax=Fictibacillus arsenicus TaxID=255247 RepID=A0A1B1Z998_9BACL|nr:DUF1648 domain-containing protein [Fictibacillus arsenicus]ANX14018.1 hypothetical protein ABE41_018555 [Fictibacillus arsenicus]
MFYENRPKLKIPRTFLENILDIVSIILFIAGAANLIMQWSSIPGTVPIHFNGAGEPDGWGSKVNLWILLVIGSIMWVLLTVLEKFPHVYNYLFITKENAERQYKNSRLMLNVIKNEILFFFVYMSWVSTEVAKGENDGLGLWILPIFIITITASIAFFIVRSIKLK